MCPWIAPGGRLLLFHRQVPSDWKKVTISVTNQWQSFHDSSSSLQTPGLLSQWHCPDFWMDGWKDGLLDGWLNRIDRWIDRNREIIFFFNSRGSPWNYWIRTSRVLDSYPSCFCKLEFTSHHRTLHAVSSEPNSSFQAHRLGSGISSMQYCPSSRGKKKKGWWWHCKGKICKMHYGKEEEWIERNLWVISLCSEWNLGAPEENLNEREIKVKGKDFPELFALSFSHAASLTQEDLNWIEEISQSWW